MELEVVILSEVIQRRRNMISLTCGIYNEMIQMNLFTKTNRDSQTQNALMVAEGGGKNMGKGQSGSLGGTSTHSVQFRSVQSLSRVRLVAIP